MIKVVNKQMNVMNTVERCASSPNIYIGLSGQMITSYTNSEQASFGFVGQCEMCISNSFKLFARLPFSCKTL